MTKMKMKLTTKWIFFFLVKWSRAPPSCNFFFLLSGVKLKTKLKFYSQKLTFFNTYTAHSRTHLTAPTPLPSLHHATPLPSLHSLHHATALSPCTTPLPSAPAPLHHCPQPLHHCTTASAPHCTHCHHCTTLPNPSRHPASALLWPT